MNTENCKRSAVELLLQGGKSVRQIAPELGISDPSLKQWKKKLAAPLTNWPRQLTNQFGNSGNFNFTDPFGTNPQTFYRLQLP